MNPSQRKTLKECIRNFTWAWHTVVMGTGALASLADLFPFGTGSLPLKIITLIFFFLNLIFFVLICGATIARYWLFPEVWPKMITHPAQSLFMGAFPMGAATLINVALATHQQWGFSSTGFLYALWGFWWLDSIVSALIAFGMLYTMMIRQNHSLDKMASVWLLPVVTLIVASSTGGLLSAALKAHSVSISLLTTAVSFVELAVGLTLAMMMITIYLLRLILHGPPDVQLILSAFVVLGPLGQGGFSLLVNGQDIANILPLHLGDDFPELALAGQMIFSVCFCGAFVLWSMGLCWITIALCSIFNVAKKNKIPFSMAYWGLIFPNAVFALLSVQLGKVTGSPFFHYFGAIWSVFVLILWIFVFLQTIPAIMNTSIFKAPYLIAPAPVISGKAAEESSLQTLHGSEEVLSQANAV